MEQFFRFQKILFQILEFIHYEGDKQSFVSESAGRAITNTYLDMLESLPEKKLLDLNKIVNREDPETIVKAIPQYLSEDEYISILNKYLSETLLSFINAISQEMTDQGKEVLQQIYKEFVEFN